MEICLGKHKCSHRNLYGMMNKYLEIEQISWESVFIWFYLEVENLNTVH